LSEIQGDGTTVLEVLSDAVDAYPELKRRVLKNDSRISTQIFVYRDDKTVITGDREHVSVAGMDSLKVFLLVGGG